MNMLGNMNDQLPMVPFGNDQLRRHAPTNSDDEMKAIFQMCKCDQWDNVLNSLKSKPELAKKTMAMANNIETTILHQAITSKGNIQARTNVIDYILDFVPEAAAVENGYRSLALHVICQRNTRLNSKTKDRLIRKLVAKYPEGLNQEGGVGKRTPVHIIFTGTPAHLRSVLTMKKLLFVVVFECCRLFLYIILCLIYCSFTHFIPFLPYDELSLLVRTLRQRIIKIMFLSI
jgi:hypothetical protein